jgi:hypothetical protein
LTQVIAAIAGSAGVRGLAPSLNSIASRGSTAGTVRR